jgi:hypothetical protein
MQRSQSPGRAVAGAILRAPGTAAAVLRGKQAEQAVRQRPLTYKEAPVTKLNRAVWQNVPGLAAALGVSLLTGQPGAGVALLGETTGGAEFADQLKAGNTPLAASVYADLAQVAEMAGEQLVLPKLVKGVTSPMSLRALVSTIAENAGQEGVTGFSQGFTNTFGKTIAAGGTIEQAVNAGLKEGLKAVPENALVGGALGGLAAAPGTTAEATSSMYTALRAKVAKGEVADSTKQAITPEEFELTEEGQKAVNRINEKLLNNESLSADEIELLDIVTTPNPVPQEAAATVAAATQTAPADPDTVSRDTAAVLDSYLADKQEQQVDADRETEVYRNKLAEAIGGKVGKPAFAEADEAMQVYVDLQNNPDQLKYYDALPSDKQAIVDRAIDLPEPVKAVADEIVAKNKEIGRAAEQAGVLQDTQESYTARIWQPSKKTARRRGRKFGTKTERARQRTLEGVLHGWSLGKELQVKGLTSAHQISRKQVYDTIADRGLLSTAMGHGLLATKQNEGWVQVNHPNFTTWQAAGKVRDAEGINNLKRSRNAYVTDSGIVMERRAVYASPQLGKHLNNILGQSAIKGLPGVDTITKLNALIKQAVLFTSFFHHQAFVRSYTLGSNAKGSELSPVAAYKAGKQAYLNFTPELRMGVRNGLTLGKIQDYDAKALDAPSSVWSRIANAAGPAGVPMQKIADLRKWNEQVLFGRMGPYLKAQAYLVEFKNLMHKHQSNILSGKVTTDELAKQAADLINDDFGGLNLDRMGRNPTVQHVFHLLALAPDWTESNVRSAVKAFKLGDEGAVYRAFWGRIVAKTVLASVVANFLLSLGDADDDFIERYRKAWANGNLRWLDVDITPIYRALGGDSSSRRYFSILGHFKDPYKFVARNKIEDGLLQGFPDPVSSLIKSGQYKGSVATRMLTDAVTGSDWAGREFTSMQELITDRKLSAWSYTTDTDPLKITQMPSILLYEAKSSTPIQVQQGIGFLSGEFSGFDAVMTSLGVHLEKGKDVPYTPSRKKRKTKVDRSAP